MKWRGGGKKAKMTTVQEMWWSWLGSATSIVIIAAIHYKVLLEENMIFLLGSFGASAVLLYGANMSPLSQPRNLIGGHVVSAILGVCLRLLFVRTGASIIVGCMLAVSLAIVAMHFTKTLHPPGGATALIAVMSGEQRWAGFYYVLVPVLSGALIMLLVALVVNNLAPKRKYPTTWK
eukprot:gene6269-7274_t